MKLLNGLFILEFSFSHISSSSSKFIIDSILSSLIFKDNSFIKYAFPVFNLADTFIVIGMFILVLDIFLEGREEGPMDIEYKKMREDRNGKNNSRRTKH